MYKPKCLFLNRCCSDLFLVIRFILECQNYQGRSFVSQGEGPRLEVEDLLLAHEQCLCWATCVGL